MLKQQHRSKASKQAKYSKSIKPLKSPKKRNIHATTAPFSSTKASAQPVTSRLSTPKVFKKSLVKFSSSSAPPLNQPTKSCWHCPTSNIPITDAFCPSKDCKSIQEPTLALSHQNYFQLFSLPIDYIVDPQQLEKNFQKLQLKFHPDLFATKSPTEQLYAEEFSSTINRSYHIISDDLLRVKYILFLALPELISDDEALPEYSQRPSLAYHPLTPNSTTPSKTASTAPSRPKPRLTHQQLTMIFLKREILEDAPDDQALFELFQENEGERLNLVNRLGLELRQHILPFLSKDGTQITRDFDKSINSLEEFDRILVDCEMLGYYQTMQRELREKINPAIFQQQ